MFFLNIFFLLDVEMLPGGHDGLRLEQRDSAQFGQEVDTSCNQVPDQGKEHLSRNEND
jgi:hypothetical protein